MYINSRNQAEKDSGVLARSSASVEDRKRKAFKRFVEEADMSWPELAKAAGFPRANFLYNYLNGHTKSLSVETIEKLDKVIPGLAGAVLHVAGSGTFKEVGKEAVTVRMAAQAGVFLTSAALPADEQYEAPMPIGRVKRALGAFGCIVRSPGFDAVYPEGSICVVMPASRLESPMAVGDYLVVERINEGRVEVTLRELSVEDGRGYLMARTKHPAYQSTITMPWPTDGSQIWKVGDDRFSVSGVVIGAYVPTRL